VKKVFVNSGSDFKKKKKRGETWSIVNDNKTTKTLKEKKERGIRIIERKRKPTKNEHIISKKT
jgi:hypothetical protein